MEFNKLGVLVYSSMKTSTQSLVQTLHHNNIQTCFIHSLHDLVKKFPAQFLDTSLQQKKAIFLEHLDNYRTINNKKLKIITVVRNPTDRQKSAFFQVHHNEEIKQNVLEENTTVNKHNVDELMNLFLTKIKNNTLAGNNESIDEISKLFDTDIISNLQNKNTHYYYENKLVKLYVLDFNSVISDNALNYLNTILNLKLTTYVGSNKSDSKSYYTKYKQFKEKCAFAEKKDTQIAAILRQRYNPFYFDAFVNTKEYISKTA